MDIWKALKKLFIVVLILIVFLLAFFITVSYRAERSYEQTMIEMERQ